MKIKFLLMPLSIALSIAVLIWMVWPAWSNGYDGAKEINAKLKQERLKYSQLENKIANAEKLFSQLSSDSEKDVLSNFIPKEILEEEIIDNVNYLASTSGLSISKLTVTPMKVIETASVDAEGGNIFSDNPGGLAVAPPPSAQKIKISLSSIGSYDSIKKFFDELYKLGRHSNLNDLELSPYLATSENTSNGTSASGILEAEMEIEFNFLPSVKITNATANDPIFLAERLDTAIFSKIKEVKSREVLKLNVSEKGKSNPFIP